MASQAVVAVSGAAFAAIGAAANLAAGAQPLASQRVWLGKGGFVGVLNGRGATAAPPASPAATPTAKGGPKPIGGKPPGEPLKAPFGTFPKHAPSKLPAPPS